MIGNKIKTRREELGLTQEELGILIGTGKTAVSNYEQNLSAPKVSILIQLFSALKCDANYLFEDYILDDNFRCSDGEKKHILKYRTLDIYGKKAINGLIETEYLRCKEQKSETGNSSDNSNTSNLSKAVRAARSADDKPIEIVERDESKFINAPAKKL